MTYPARPAAGSRGLNVIIMTKDQGMASRARAVELAVVLLDFINV